MGGAMTGDAIGNLSLQVRIALKLRSSFVGEDHNHHRPNIYSGMRDTLRRGLRVNEPRIREGNRAGSENRV